MSHSTSQRWKLVLNIITIVAFVGLAYALRHQIADTFYKIQEVNYWVLFLILPFEALNYHGQAKLYQNIFAVLGSRLRYKFLYGVSLELNFVNTVFPSAGVSGFSYFGLRLRAHGISGAKATLAQMMKLILVFVSFQVLMAAGLIILAAGSKANDFVILIAGSLTTLLLIGTLSFAFILGSRRRINSFFTFATKGINRIIHIVRPDHPETINVQDARNMFDELHDNYMHIKRHYKLLLYPLLYALAANVTEILVIYSVYVAFGQWVNIGAVIIAYAIANFAGLISVLPGGVGIYEALMTGVLVTAGIPASVSLPVTVMYRILNMGVQLPPGYVLYQRALRNKQEVAHE